MQNYIMYFLKCISTFTTFYHTISYQYSYFFYGGNTGYDEVPWDLWNFRMHIWYFDYMDWRATPTYCIRRLHSTQSCPIKSEIMFLEGLAKHFPTQSSISYVTLTVNGDGQK